MYSLPQKEGRAQDIKRMMDAYGDDVLRTAYMYLGDMHKAEDAFQEAFIRVYSKLGSFKGQSSEKTWIIKITINVCRDMLRAPWLKRVLLTDRPQAGRTDDAEEKAIQSDERRTLLEAVTALAAPFKDVVLLYYYHGLPTAEIASVLGTAEGTVRSRLARAREMLKDKLQGRIDFDE